MMQSLRAMLHGGPHFTADDASHVEEALAVRRKQRLYKRRETQSDDIEIPLTTISMGGNFDSYLNVYLNDEATVESAIFDSGNTSLVYPRMENIQALPNWQSSYTVLASGVSEPWGCPANIVQGPILLEKVDGSYLSTIMTFYACTGNNRNGARTSNFGSGCVSPWSSNGWNTPSGTSLTLFSPLAYTSFDCVEINFAAQDSVLSRSAEVKVSDESYLKLTNSPDSSYTFLNIIENYAWMSVYVVWLAIDSNLSSGWPSPYPGYAFIDTGGGPANLSDPNGVLYNKTWPDPATIPAWAETSLNCIATSAPIGIELQDANGKQFGYYIDTSNQPAPAQGLTLVMCQTDNYMMGQNGMNVGGVTALAINICVNYSNATIGFYKKSASS